ncbi:hypothetical protein lerEdw1_012520 [Lerista edwardsae]|nr:hypothetical protein lerEdw1_012520 [Lerista edwardsae]
MTTVKLQIGANAQFLKIRCSLCNISRTPHTCPGVESGPRAPPVFTSGLPQERGQVNKLGLLQGLGLNDHEIPCSTTLPLGAPHSLQM